MTTPPRFLSPHPHFRAPPPPLTDMNLRTSDNPPSSDVTTSHQRPAARRKLPAHTSEHPLGFRAHHGADFHQIGSARGRSPRPKSPLFTS